MSQFRNMLRKFAFVCGYIPEILIFSFSLVTLTLSYTGLFRLVLHDGGGGGGGGAKSTRGFFFETVKATAIKFGTLTN